MASHSPETPTAVAELIEAELIESDHIPQGNKVSTRQPDYRPHWKPGTKDSPKPDQGKNEGLPSSRLRETKPLLEIVCYKCNKKGHMARNCTAKTFHALEKADRSNQCFFAEGEVNGWPVGRIQVDSWASRTIVNRSLVSPAADPAN